MTYETLGQLLGCYLHQDWPDEFGDDTSALQAIIISEPREKVLASVSEIDALLQSSLSEAELKGLLTGKVGCYFDPTSDGMTYEKWLTRVREVLAKG